jgi:hypothetical protein
MDTSKLIVEKLSQYNFITNILAGTILCVVLRYIIGYDLLVTDPYLSSIIFYFVGIVVNRVDL